MYWEKKADLDTCAAYFRIFFINFYSKDTQFLQGSSQAHAIFLYYFTHFFPIFERLSTSVFQKGPTCGIWKMKARNSYL